MAARRGGNGNSGDSESSGDSEFRRAMRGVRPLEGRDERRPPPEPKAPARRASRPKPPVRFEIDQHGEHVFGLAEGTDTKHLARLRSGAIETDRRVDLHGLDTVRARRKLRSELEAARKAGERCVLVVHGRGHRSVEGPVLKRALPEWLAEPPIGSMVMAFASAAAREGGPGATRVLLRRSRR